MINQKASIEALQGMETHELCRIIDEDYYRSMIGCKPDEVSSIVDRLVTELVDVQMGCALAERYDLAIACKGRLTALAMQMKLKDLL